MMQDNQVFEDQKNELISDYKKTEPELFKQYEYISSVYAPEIPVAIEISVREDSTNG